MRDDWPKLGGGVHNGRPEWGSQWNGRTPDEAEANGRRHWIAGALTFVIFVVAGVMAFDSPLWLVAGFLAFVGVAWLVEPH